MVTRLDKAGVVSSGSTAERTLEDRFSEVVNVKDYGAKGDGTTDDTAAIQAAIDTEAGRIFLPAGRYKMDSIVYVWYSNMIIEGEAGTTLLPRHKAAIYVRGTEEASHVDPEVYPSCHPDAGDPINAWYGVPLESPLGNGLGPDYSVGDTNYTTASAHSLTVGDFACIPP
jgi:polygalacturonase